MSAYYRPEGGYHDIAHHGKFLFYHRGKMLGCFDIVPVAYEYMLAFGL
jgi:hypothetical protein